MRAPIRSNPWRRFFKNIFLFKDSDHSSDDLSSGVFSSCNSHTEGHLEWSTSANQPSSYCFEGKAAGLCQHVTRWLTVLFSPLLLSSLWYSRCWHLDWERAGRVSEDSWASAGQSGPRRYRDQWSGKREKIGAECSDAFRYPVGFSFQFVCFFPIYFDLNGSFKERTLSWNKKYETCHRSRIEKWNLIHETFESKWFAHRITLQSDPSSFAKYALFPHRNM